MVTKGVGPVKVFSSGVAEPRSVVVDVIRVDLRFLGQQLRAPLGASAIFVDSYRGNARQSAQMVRVPEEALGGPSASWNNCITRPLPRRDLSTIIIRM